MDEEEKKEVIEDVIEEDGEEEEEKEEEKEEPDPEPEEDPEPEPESEAPAEDGEVTRKLNSIIETLGMLSKAVAQLSTSRGVETPDVKAELSEDTSEPKAIEDMDFSLDTGTGSDEEDNIMNGNYVD